LNYGNGNIVYRGANGYKVRNYFNNKTKKNEFIIYNSNIDFEKCHTHINNFYLCKKLIWCVVHKQIDKEICTPYLLVSLKRISKNRSFIRQIDEKLNELDKK
jgi:hypothetical protein